MLLQCASVWLLAQLLPRITSSVAPENRTTLRLSLVNARELEGTRRLLGSETDAQRVVNSTWKNASTVKEKDTVFDNQRMKLASYRPK